MSALLLFFMFLLYLRASPASMGSSPPRRSWHEVAAIVNSTARYGSRNGLGLAVRPARFDTPKGKP
jgi:hypothetical protein